MTIYNTSTCTQLAGIIRMHATGSRLFTVLVNESLPLSRGFYGTIHPLRQIRFTSAEAYASQAKSFLRDVPNKLRKKLLAFTCFFTNFSPDYARVMLGVKQQSGINGEP